MLRKVWASSLGCLLFFVGNSLLAQIPSPALLVLEKNDKSMAIVDPGTLKVVGRVPAGEDPHEIVASEDGKYAYISNYGAFQNPQHTISIADLSAQKALPAVDLGALRAPHGLEMVNGKVYFTARDGVITVLKAGPTFEVVARNPLGEEIYASPAVSDGQIFLRTLHHLYCVGKTEKAAK